MNIALLLIPLLLLMSVMYLYRYSGKRQLLHFDSVQFLYAFVIFPLGYVWLKHFLFFLIRGEIGISISTIEWLRLDSAFTIIFIYIYAFTIIHSLTKTFSLQLNRDPLFDIFATSKYFHEYYSHIGMYGGLIGVITVFSLLNVLFPFAVTGTKFSFYMTLAFATFIGMVFYVGAFVMTDKGVNYSTYRKIIKLAFALSFLSHIFVYFYLAPSFSFSYVGYWFIFATVASFIFCTFYLTPTRRIMQLFEVLRMDKGID